MNTHKRIAFTCALAISTWSAVAAAEPILIAESEEGCRVYIDGKDFVAEGCNLHVRDDSGSTQCDGDCDGTGNVVIGWNRDPNYREDGNHNLVMGSSNGYMSYGSIVHGVGNVSWGANGATVGSRLTSTHGERGVVIGGTGANAAGEGAVVVGGSNNRAESIGGVVVSGSGNRVGSNSNYGVAVGGSGNATASHVATVVGGRNNLAAGWTSAITGGQDNETQGNYSTITGGHGNLTEGVHASILGDADVTLSDDYATFAGTTVDTAYHSVGTLRLDPKAKSPLYTVTFSEPLPCTPNVHLQVYNTGGGQLAPFIASVNSRSSTSFTYYLYNPADALMEGYTMATLYTAFCE